MKTKVSLLLASILFLALPWAVYAQRIYMTDDTDPSVLTWPETASGNMGPTTTITGAATTMVRPLGIAVDSNAIYVADCDQSSIDVFPINGDGNIAPSRSIQGAITTLDCPVGVAVDANWIYVTNYNHNSIDVFPISGSGNIAPSRSIQGANTTFDSPYRLALDANWLYVSNRDGHSILTFPKDGNGNIPPTRSIQGAATGLGAPWGIAVDSSRIYIANYGTTAPNVLVFPLSASGNVSPDQVIQGPATGLQSPGGIAVSQAIPLYEGTIGTEMAISGSGFGIKKGKVLVGSASLKILEWTDVLIRCQLTKDLYPGAYDVIIKPQARGSSPVVIANGFRVKGPEIDSISPTSGSIGDEVTIQGLFFGTKKGKVTVGGKTCRVLSWTMDFTTGEGTIQAAVPKGLSSGAQEFEVTNKEGADTIEFTVK